MDKQVAEVSGLRHTKFFIQVLNLFRLRIFFFPSLNGVSSNKNRHIRNYYSLLNNHSSLFRCTLFIFALYSFP